MNTTTDMQPRERQLQYLDVLRVLVLLQGAMLLLVALETIVMVAFAGPAIVGVFLLSTGATVLTLLTVKGLRKRKRWARRVTLVSEWAVLALASLDAIFTIVLVGSVPPLVPILVGFGIPIAALRLVRVTKPLFVHGDDLTAKSFQRVESSETLPKLDALI